MQVPPDAINVEAVVKISAVVLSVLTNIAFVAKYFIDRKDTKGDKNIQLIDKWIERLSAELVAADLSDKQKDEKIEKLQRCVVWFEEKLKTTTLFILEHRAAMRAIKKCCKALKITDEEFLTTINEFEESLKQHHDCMKEPMKDDK